MRGVPLPESPGESLYIPSDSLLVIEPWVPAKRAVPKHPERLIPRLTICHLEDVFKLNLQQGKI
jgi:hypothetical protein